MKPSMRMSHFNKIDVQKWLQDRRFSNYRVSPEKNRPLTVTVRGGSVLTFYYGVFDAYRLNPT